MTNRLEGGNALWVVAIAQKNTQTGHRYEPGARAVDTIRMMSYDEAEYEARMQYNNAVEDRQSIRYGTGSARYYNFEYRDVNESLRYGYEMDDDIYEVYEGMKEAMQPLTRDYTVFRGWRNNPGYARREVGEEFASSQFYEYHHERTLRSRMDGI